MRYADTIPKSYVVASESVNFPRRAALERAVGKLVLIGEHAGVTPDDMILLLNSGLTVRELLEYIAACEHRVA